RPRDMRPGHHYPTGIPTRITTPGTYSPLNNSVIIVLMTASSSEEADRLADMLVNGNLAACVQILPPIRSVYRWQGSIERSSEVLLIAKTVTDKFVELEQRVRAVHSYETPEIVALPVTAISEPYREWLSASIDAE
ncbi:MAG TPA: divalent-cation tolerance protein CutA, partial [Pyrinomonadaceae bacterium]|nr:divalent-cation tolerance protein CutA [Pyrinomonadaceae bacterium]